MQLSSPSANARLAGFFLAFGLLAAACGGDAESGVNVKSIATDLTYGIPEPEKAARPANIDPVPDAPVGTVSQNPGPGPVRIPPPAGLRPTLCREAPPNVFPAPVTSEIDKKPLAGEYMWPVKGDQQIPGIGKASLPPLTRKFIEDVTDTENGGYTFVIEERELVFGSPYTVRTHYEVRKSLTGTGEQNGLYMTKIERVHPSDEGSNSEFNPSPAILMLPTPTEIGAQVDSAGVDPSTLEAMRQDAAIIKRQRVNACGTPVDTFYVQGTQEFVSASGQSSTRRYDYGVATAEGGYIAVEHVEAPCAPAEQPDPTSDVPPPCQKDAVTFRMDTHIGQLKPTKR